MRERLALAVLALTLALLVGLSAIFAVRHNPPEPARPPQPESAAPPARATPVPAIKETTTTEEQTSPLPFTGRGARLYVEQQCAACHSIAGAGNPRFPLDGVGARLNEEALRHGILGSGPVAERISPVVVRRKERYRPLSEDDLVALVNYLGQLR